jgi:hypothetical protein
MGPPLQLGFLAFGISLCFIDQQKLIKRSFIRQNEKQWGHSV